MAVMDYDTYTVSWRFLAAVAAVPLRCSDMYTSIVMKIDVHRIN